MARILKNIKESNPLTQLTHLIFAFIIFLISLPAKCEVTFIAGYAVIGGIPQTKLTSIFPGTIIVCDPTCIFKSESKTVRLDYAGYGTVENMLKVSSPQTSVDHLVADMNGKIDFKIGSILIKETKRLDVLKNKKTEYDPKLDEPVPEGAKGLIAHQVNVIDQINSIKNQYPTNGALVLHKHGGLLYVVPQTICPDKCKLEIKFNGANVVSKTFTEKQKTFATFTASASTEGIVQWTFSDEEIKKEGAFEVRRYNSTIMSQAIKDQRMVEVIP
jgi:hypothetical protein